MGYSSLLSVLAGADSLVKKVLAAHDVLTIESNYSNVTTPPPPVPGPITFAPPSSASLEPREVALPVHLTVLILISLLVSILFIAIYVQLIMVIWFGYKLFTYQTTLLFSILLWAALRLTLYSFYYYHCCESVRMLAGVPGWLVVEFPAVLQYFSLAILVRYFVEVSEQFIPLYMYMYITCVQYLSYWQWLDCHGLLRVHSHAYLSPV